MNIEKLKIELEKISIHLDDNQYNQIDTFCDYLLLENKNTNLTAIRDKESVFLKHIYDSLSLTKILYLKDEKIYQDESCTKLIEKVLDIGTGPGFPGIILKIAFPYLKITLLDSNNKKTTFLNKAVEILKLQNVKIIHQRAESFAVQNIESYDMVTSRAVAKLNILLELSVPCLKISGIFIAMKGIHDELEKQDAEYASQILNSRINRILEFKLPLENSDRTLYLVEKTSSTPQLYPRQYDKILRNPLKKNN